MKDMKILFVRARERFPYGAAEAGAPVAGPSVFLVGKVKKLSVRTVRILFCRFKPGMLVGAVVDHQIHQQIHAALFCLGDQFVHIFHGAEPWIDGVIIGNVVALICQGRFIDRGKPEHIHAQFFQIIQFLNNSLKISDSVPVGIIKTFRVNLVENFVMPPFAFHFCFLHVK